MKKLIFTPLIAGLSTMMSAQAANLYFVAERGSTAHTIKHSGNAVVINTHAPVNTRTVTLGKIVVANHRYCWIFAHPEKHKQKYSYRGNGCHDLILTESGTQLQAKLKYQPKEELAKPSHQIYTAPQAIVPVVGHH